MTKFLSTKTYGHEQGLSVCFRQHKATHSHCSKLHGYAIAVKLTFGCSELDDKNWVQDFGGLKKVKNFLTDHFDHTLVIADDDPELEVFRDLERIGLVDLVTMPKVGCEAFAQFIFQAIEAMFVEEYERSDHHRVWIESVEVMEHGANSAIYKL